MNSLIRKAEEFINKHPIKLDKDTLYVFCTDSKGKRLIHHAPIVYKYNFLWRNVGGRTTEVGVNSIISELSTISKLKPKVKLIFWHGTCDITRKDANNLLNLKTTDNERVVNNIKIQYEKLYTAVAKYKNIQLYLMEIPPISVSTYNRINGCTLNYTDADKQVETQVKLHNNKVRELNKRTDVSSPMFTEDLKISKKQGGSKKQKPTKYLYKFELTTDGVHPKKTLAKKWLHKIINKVNSC